MTEFALIIFIKNPQLGKVKTRLAATVGNEKALQIYHALTDYTRQEAQKLLPEISVYVFYSDFVDMNDGWDNSIFQKRVQQGIDLGERMYHAFSEVLQQHKGAIIIGSDCPQLTHEGLSEAFQHLETADFAIGKADDGGYYLLGMQYAEQSLFEGIDWSTENVFLQTIRKMQTLKGKIYYASTLTDIDTEADWLRYGWEL